VRALIRVLRFESYASATTAVSSPSCHIKRRHILDRQVPWYACCPYCLAQHPSQATVSLRLLLLQILRSSR
jgi:hypothetical protein